MTTDELKQEAEEYTKNLLKKLGIKEDMLLENQPKYLRQESMNFVALDVENVTDAYLASAELREKRIAELEAQIEKMKNCKNCANYMISGKCPSFFRTGWCKNWKLAD